MSKDMIKLRKFYYEKFSLRNSKESFDEFITRDDRGAKQAHQTAVFYNEFLHS